MSPYREWIQKQNDFLKRGCINPKTILQTKGTVLLVCGLVCSRCVDTFTLLFAPKQIKRTVPLVCLWFENPPIIIPNAQLPGHIQCHRIVNGFKNKNIKNSLGAMWNASHLGVCDCAFCAIGNEFPCRQPHNPTPTLLRGLSTLPQG